MMSWFIEHNLGDSVVEKDQMQFDRLPSSPNSWSEWGIYGFDNGRPNKIVDANGVKTHIINNNNNSPLQHNLEGSSDDSLPWNSATSECTDMQFNNLTESEMDDIFSSSLLHDDVLAAAQIHNKQISSSAERIFQGMPCVTEDVGCSNYFNTPSSFLPTTAGSNNDHSCVPSISYGDSLDQNHTHNQSKEELETMDMLLCNNDQEAIGEDSSMNESMLMDLEAVLSQMNSKTRLCFRDSLYRLAQRSQPQMSAEEASPDGLTLDKPVLVETSDALAQPSRVDSENNSIDRAVADLMFQNPYN